MKKILILIVAMLFVASAAYATIPGSAHDLSPAGPALNAHGTTSYQNTDALGISACQYCHTPHQADISDQSRPLWNRNMPAAAGFIVYDSGNAAGGVAGVAGKTLSGTTVNAPGGHSLSCMSCHDGVTGLGDIHLGGDTIGTYDANLAGSVMEAIYANAAGLTVSRTLGTDLRSTHPVGVNWRGAAATYAGLDLVAPAALNGVANVFTVGAGNVYRVYVDGADKRVECGSCHDPHGSDYAAGGANAPFLRGAKSAMCTTCHSHK
jgi:predicted CXXCH cytochrome family protein